jgi:O-antigen ligase
VTFSLEKISKNVLLLGLALLLFRNTSFVLTHMLKPFEVCFIIVSLLTLFDLVWNKKFPEFFSILPKRLWIAIIALLSSIALGWIMAAFYRHIPFTVNMVFEVLAFLVAASTGLLALYYARNDPSYIKKCLYALSASAVYAVFILFPQAAYFFHLAQGGTFNGFTDNVNVVSKALLIPLFFFAAQSLFPQKRAWHRVAYILLSISLFALVFWTAQRAATLGFLLGAFAVWLVVSFTRYDWKKMLSNGLLLLMITIFGFLAVPHQGKKAGVDRIFDITGRGAGYTNVENRSLFEIVKSALFSDSSKGSPEPRLEIWPYYSAIAWHNPLGLGPNTHMNVHIVYPEGELVNPGPHNTYIELWLWGGIIGIASFLYLLWYAFARLIVSLRKEVESTHLALLGALTALCVSIFFNDNIGFIWFWVVLALSIGI